MAGRSRTVSKFNCGKLAPDADSSPVNSFKMRLQSGKKTAVAVSMTHTTVKGLFATKGSPNVRTEGQIHARAMVVKSHLERRASRRRAHRPAAFQHGVAGAATSSRSTGAQSEIPRTT
jgi:hypothetical protein